MRSTCSNFEVCCVGRCWYGVVNGEELLPIDDASDPRRMFGDPVYPEAMDIVPTSFFQSGATPESGALPSPLAPQLNTEGLDTAAVVANGWPGSPNTLKDFVNMEKVFRDRGYAVTTVVPNASRAAKTRTDIIEALEAIGGERAEPYQQVVFYYTGHGTEGGLVLGAEMNSSYILSVQELAEVVAGIDAIETILILDACHTGAFVYRFRQIFQELYDQTDRSVAVYSASTATQLSWTEYRKGGAFTNALLEKINLQQGLETLPFKTQGGSFKVDPLGFRHVVPLLGNDTRQTPQTDFICPCPSGGTTEPIRFNASYAKGNTNCGQPADFVSLLMVDWYDGEATVRQTEIGTLHPGTSRGDGSFFVDQPAGGGREAYDAAIFCDCGGFGSYAYTDAASCVTTWEMTLSKQPD